MASTGSRPRIIHLNTHRVPMSTRTLYTLPPSPYCRPCASVSLYTTTTNMFIPRCYGTRDSSRVER